MGNTPLRWVLAVDMVDSLIMLLAVLSSYVSSDLFGFILVKFGGFE